MKKALLIAAGVFTALVLLMGVTVLTGINVVRAAAQVGRSLSRNQVAATVANVARAAGVSAPAVVTPTADEKGMVVVIVEQGGPAAQAGLKRGDILLKIDNQDVNNQVDLRNALRDHKAGDKVTLTVTHGDDERTLTVTLGDRNGVAYLGLVPFGGPLPRMGMGMPFTFTQGLSGTHALVTEVVTGSPAEKAGLKRGDIIVSVDGTQVSTDNGLASLIGQHKPGDTVTLEVMQPGTASRQVKVQLGENPDKKGAAYLGVRYLQTPGVEVFRRGEPSRPRSVPALPKGAVKQGAVVRDVTNDSPAQKAGLRAGDVITAIDGKAVDSPQALAETVASHKPGDQITLSVQRNNSTNPEEVKVTLGENPEKKGSAYLGVTLGGFNLVTPSGDSAGLQLPDLNRFLERMKPFIEQQQQQENGSVL
jgi:S1-C subfamily serine protease